MTDYMKILGEAAKRPTPTPILIACGCCTHGCCCHIHGHAIKCNEHKDLVGEEFVERYISQYA